MRPIVVRRRDLRVRIVGEQFPVAHVIHEDDDDVRGTGGQGRAGRCVLMKAWRTRREASNGTCGADIGSKRHHLRRRICSEKKTFGIPGRERPLSGIPRRPPAAS
jgi:hypothetical protein